MGKSQAGHINSHVLLTVCLCTCLHGWLNYRGPRSFHSLMAQWEPLPLEGCRLSPSWCFLEEARLSWWPVALPSLCPICNPVFHGELEHVVSGPNGLPGWKCVFWWLFRTLHKDMWTTMVIIWILTQIVWKATLKKKKAKWGFYTWGVELPVNSSGNSQFLYFLASLQRSFGL